jgi:hypothetical protein
MRPSDFLVGMARCVVTARIAGGIVHRIHSPLSRSSGHESALTISEDNRTASSAVRGGRRLFMALASWSAVAVTPLSSPMERPLHNAASSKSVSRFACHPTRAVHGSSKDFQIGMSHDVKQFAESRSPVAQPITTRRFGNLRYSRLGSLRYKVASLNATLTAQRAVPTTKWHDRI